jgi:tripartite ATP-independent transporter DctM subunit
MLGAPLPHALLSALSLAVPLGSLLPLTGVLQTAVSGVSSFLLLAIPFFLLAGTLMLTGGLANRLVVLADTLVGHRRGGLAQTTLLTNVFFSGISGSSLADAAFGAKVLAPGLVARGYRPELAAAIVASTAVLPNILPPSVAFLMLAVATNLSIGALFVGGLVGGLFIALVFAITFRLIAPDTGSSIPASGAQRWVALRRASPVLGLGFIILLGIRLGVVTTTEASALAAGYALFLAWIFIRRSPRTGAALTAAFMQAAREASAVGLLIGATAPFTFLLAVDQVPAALETWSQSVSGDPFTFLLFANVLLLIVGCPLEIGVAILLFAPLLMPAAVSAGIDPIHFGVLIVVNLMIGSLTPPVGSLVFIAAGIAGLPAGKVFQAALPLVGALILGLLVMSAAAGLWAIF